MSTDNTADTPESVGQPGEAPQPAAAPQSEASQPTVPTPAASVPASPGVAPQGFPAPAHPATTTAMPTVAQGWAPPAAGTHHPQSPFGHAATAPQYAYAAAPGAPSAPGGRIGAGKVAGLLVAAALIGGAAGLGGTYAGMTLFAPETVMTATGPANVTVNDTDSVNQTTGIAAKVLPSVVTIDAVSTAGGGTGSGVILTEDGYVVTNTHVVTLDGATANPDIRVTTADGRVYDAEIVGTDPTYDLAVIKLVGAQDLTPIEFADSAALNVGDQSIAIGAPLGLSNTVTTGIVSALNRSIEISSSAAPDTGDGSDGGQGEGDGGQGDSQQPFYFDFGQGRQGTPSAESIKIAVIQTDAAINPGNSGGALVDSEGRLIGINVAIASAGGASSQAGSIGVGFAIPSNVVERVSNEIIENGAATHGLLGATVKDAATVDGSNITGAYIVEVTDGGGAQRGGLQAGDTVTAFNGVPISDATDLTAQVRAAAAGSDATVTFVRGGQSRTVDVTLGQLAS